LRFECSWCRRFGYKAHRSQIEFADDPVTLGEQFDKLEKLCGGASGCQMAQKLGGFRNFWPPASLEMILAPLAGAKLQPSILTGSPSDSEPVSLSLTMVSWSPI
jgi:hypothetical protein